MSANFGDLSFKERLLFQNNEAVFLNKKRLFILNAQISRKIRALHEKLKLSNNRNSRKKIAEELLKLDNERFENYKIIDE